MDSELEKPINQEPLLLDDNLERYYSLEGNPIDGIRIMGVNNITEKHHLLPPIHSVDAGLAVVDFLRSRGKISSRQASVMKKTILGLIIPLNWTDKDKRNFPDLYEQSIK